jgi:hypothetical protein
MEGMNDMTIIDWNAAIDDYLKSKERRRDAYEPDLFTASSISGCVRQCLKTRLNIGSPGSQTLRHFFIGSTFHRIMQTEVSIGHIGHPAEFEKQIAFEMDGIRFKGHIDCVTSHEIIDFKTTSNAKTSLSFPTAPAYLYQLAIYKEGMRVLEPEVERETALVYIDKRNMQAFRKSVAPIPMADVIFFCKQVVHAEQLYTKNRILPPKDGCYSCLNECD